MRVFEFVLRLLVGLMFLFSAIPKLAGSGDAVREDLQIASWFWQLAGLVELIGALALLASLWYVRLALPAGLWLVGLMTGALIAHIRVDDQLSAMAFPAALLLVSALVAALGYRRLEIADEPEPAEDRTSPSVPMRE